MPQTPEYKAWYDAKARCTDPTHGRYPLYGGRGITMCKAFQQNFQAFLSEVGLRPGKGYSLDRIDNDRGYEPGNLRWATRSEQNRNRRSKPNQRTLTLAGETRTIMDWSKLLGIKHGLIRERLKLGHPVEDALSTQRLLPTRKNNLAL